jgi:prepilin-type N-terminal cleavage/methylation domain-containing protein
MFKSRRKAKSGFTLIEVLIVLGLIAILSTMVVMYSVTFYGNTLLQEDSEYVLNALRKARSYAITGKEDSDWGVKFIEAEDKYVVFKGNRYTERDTDYDLEFEIVSSYQIDFDEVVFQKTTGTPQVFGGT